MPGVPWWCPVRHPRRHLDHLTTAVMLRRIINLADAAPTFTDTELVGRLVALAGCVGRPA